jgi:hypothetical protein
MRETVYEGEFLWYSYLENSNLEDQEGSGRYVLNMGDVKSGEGQGGDGKKIYIMGSRRNTLKHYFIPKRFKVISFVMNVNSV